MNVKSIIDNRISGYQWQILAICFLISVVDGLDSQIMSVAGPVIAREMSLPASALGPMLSASQWGALAGAFIFGFLADKIGRRPVLVMCGLILSLTMLATALAASYESLVMLRVVTGLGVGGAVPCFLSLAMEYSPERHRGKVVSAMVAAVPCGGIVAGVLGAALLSRYDWQTVFWACGYLSIGVTALLIFGMPESVAFLIERKKSVEEIRRILQKIAPGSVGSNQTGFVLDGSMKVPGKASVLELFRGRLASVTLLSWAAFFMSYLVLIGTLVWTPALMRRAGMEMGEASTMLSLNNIGSIAGLFVVGYVTDKFRSRFWLLLSGVYIFGSMSVILMGHLAPAVVPTGGFSALTGFFMASSVGVLYAFVAQVYPTKIRSTGLGWASGMGRLGSSSGPLVLGFMFAKGWDLMSILYVVALLTVAVVVIIGLMKMVTSANQPEPQPA